MLLQDVLKINQIELKKNKEKKFTCKITTTLSFAHSAKKETTATTYRKKKQSVGQLFILFF